MPLKRLVLFCIMLSTFSVAAFATLPGADQYGTGLLKKITNLEKLRGKSYQPRTKHLTGEGKARYTNRLFLESSPYLLQHAHNPVNWYPWGEEAFAAAARLNRPVLLSVGYSTCHWCHVMEEESFEDLEIATYINQHYIAIKVDREERPDIDAIYMAALHAMGQGGGWPMNVWLTADKKPFFGGTYFPPRDGDRGADIGLLTLLKKINKAYHEAPDEVAAVSKNISKAIKLSLQPVAGDELPTLNIMHLAAAYYKENTDHFYGGTGNAPKFPSTMPIQFLLRYYWRTGDKELLKMVELTLTKMAAGGLYDQVGGGFHRYSTDNEWLVPHFEKMLYDNALLSIDYLEAYQVTHNENFRRIVNETLGYIKRDMTSPAGGFYSATDADSLVPSGKREEGYYFTWSADELEQVLGKEAAVIKQYYAVTEQGNFEARNILNTPVSIAEFSEQHGIDKTALLKLISNSKQLLYEQRKKRQPPIRDEKIISAWNGLMISAYAKAGLILNNSDYVQQAVQAADFILNNMFINGRLFRSYKDGVAKHNAYLSDYAFLIAGLLDLYEASSDIKWLKQALLLDTVLESHYEDQQQGGFFLTSNDHEQLLAREKPNYDAAEPTGNSVQILNLFRLGEFTSKQSYKSRGIKALKSFSGILNTNPMALSKMLLAVDFYYDSAKEIIIITAENNKHSADSLIAEFRKQYLPNRVYAVIAEGDELNMQTKIITIAEGKKTIKGRATAYVCKQGACELPTYNAQRFLQQISKKEYPSMKLQKESSD